MFAIIRMMLLGEIIGEMKMVFYNLRIEKQKIYGADKISVAADATETISLRFQFDASWRIFDSKAAIFKTADNRYYIIELTGSTVKIPWEVLTLNHNFELSVIAFDGKEALTAGSVTISMQNSLLPEDCKALSPSETLFDKFEKESMEKAHEIYKSKIASMQSDYQKKIFDLGIELNKEKANTVAVEAKKIEEIKKLEQEHSAEIYSLNTTVNSLKAEISQLQEKADNWDLVNAAMSDKTDAGCALWFGGTQEYRLPMIDTKNITDFSAAHFDEYVSEMALDCSSLKYLDGSFSELAGLKKITLKNTEKASSMRDVFSGCPSLREADVGITQNCNYANHAFYDCRSLEKVKIGSTRSIMDYSYMFSGCTALKEIIGDLDLLVSTTLLNAFSGCTSLEHVNFVEDSITTSLDLSSCQSLSKDSMDSVFKGLSKGKNLDLSVSKYAFDNNYTPAEQAEIIEQAAAKGWEITIF